MPHQTDARETRVFASEIKFVVPAELGLRIREWARHRLVPDPHGTGPCGDEYHTTSLYFDTRAFDVFHRHGSFARCKYRIRRYGTDDLMFLERKLRKPRLLIKRRTAGTLQDLHRLTDTCREPVEGTCPEPVEGITPDRRWHGDWFHRRLLIRQLRPTCQLSYQRTARTVVNGDGPARLTVDGGICAASIDRIAFTDGGVPVLDGSTIVELKYPVQLPAIFKRLVEEFALRTTAVSKYRLGMAVLGHVAASDTRRLSPARERRRANA